jgi:hypothetical protein
MSRFVAIVRIVTMARRVLTSGISHLRAQMMPVKLQQLISHHPPQPQEQRLRRLPEELRLPSGSGHECILHYVSRIKTPTQSPVHSELNNPRQSFLMEGK